MRSEDANGHACPPAVQGSIGISCLRLNVIQASLLSLQQNSGALLNPTLSCALCHRYIISVAHSPSDVIATCSQAPRTS